MFNPIRLCNDLFDDEKLSNANLRGFTENLLIRTSGNNPGGIYTSLINDTTAKYNLFYGKITSEAVKDAIGQGLTKTTYTAWDEAIKEVSHLQALVIYRFGETGETYQEFYPHGMLEYQEAKIDDISTLFDRFLAAAAAHLAAVEQADIITKVAAFKAARAAQVTVFAEVDVLGTGKHADRKVLTIQITFDFLTIASNNIDNEDAFDDYFDPRFLPLTEGVQSITLDGEINPGEIVSPDTAAVTFKADTDMLFENNTATTMRWYFTTSPGNGTTGNFVDVGPNNSIAKKAGEINFSAANPVLCVQNIGGFAGKYKVKIYI